MTERSGHESPTRALSGTDFAAGLGDRYFEDYMAGAVYGYGYASVSEADISQIGRLEAPPDGFAEMAFSPDSRILAIGGGAGADLLSGITQTGVVRLWDIATRHQIGRLPASAGGFDAVAFSPDAKTIATGDGDRTVRLWDVATRHQIGSPLAARGAVSSVAFSPDGAMLAVGDTAGPVQLWDMSYLSNVLSRVCDLAAGSFTHAEWTKYVPSGPAYRELCP